MNELIKVEVKNVNGILVTTSNKVAEELGVNHKDLLEKIDGYIEKFSSAELSAQFYIPHNYKDRSGKSNRNYLITKKGVAQLIGGYNAAVEKAFELNVSYINEFERMENYLKNEFKVPSTFSEALRLAAEQQEMIEVLENKIQEDKPKVEFYNDVTDSKHTCDMQTVAKVLNFKGVGRNTLFEILRNENILQPDNKPYQKFVDAGWFRLIETKYNDEMSGELRIYFKTVVFQKGIEKISNILKQLGYSQLEK